MCSSSPETTTQRQHAKRGGARIRGPLTLAGAPDEIAAVPRLMAELGVTGVLFTADALHCQKDGLAQAAATGNALLVRVKDNLYMIGSASPTDKGAFTGGNTGMFIADKGVVLVDTKLPGYGPRILERVKAVTPKPVIMVINTHTHAPMVLYRGLADDLALMDWLTKYIFPVEKATVSPDFVRVGTRLAALEMIESGTTTFVDMYYFEDDIADVTRAVVERVLAGERGWLGILTGEGAPPVEELLADVGRTHPGVDVEVHEGGQPHYPLLLVAE